MEQTINEAAGGEEEQDLEIGTSRELLLAKGMYNLQGMVPSVLIAYQAS